MLHKQKRSLKKRALDADGAPSRHSLIVEPLYHGENLPSAQLPCVVLRNGRILSDNGLPKFCYEPGTTILRYTRGQGWDESVYNHIFQFGDRFFARDVEVAHGGKPFLNVHLSKVETLRQLDSALFLPPPDCPGPITEPVKVPGRLLAASPEGTPFPPRFPKGIRGKVTVIFRWIGRGTLRRQRRQRGRKNFGNLQKKQQRIFVFRPFLLLGKPVEVESTMLYDIHDRLVIRTTLP